MKLFLFVLIFSWSSSVLSVDQQGVNKFGHWPLENIQIYQAVMPAMNKRVIGTDFINKVDPPELPDALMNLLQASWLGVVSLTPFLSATLLN